MHMHIYYLQYIHMYVCICIYRPMYMFKLDYIDLIHFNRLLNPNYSRFF